MKNQVVGCGGRAGRRLLMVLGMALMSVLTLPCVAKEAVQTAAKAAQKNVTGGNLGTLYKARIQASTPERREMVVKACVAGLYAIGDLKSVQKIRAELKDADFIDSLMDDCSQCSGSGTAEPRPCSKCKGSGKCPNSKCNNGMTIEIGFNGYRRKRNCSICGGSGGCPSCKGKGEFATTCSRCRGAKRVAQKETALAACKELLASLSVQDKDVRKKTSADAQTVGAEVAGTGQDKTRPDASEEPAGKSGKDGDVEAPRDEASGTPEGEAYEKAQRDFNRAVKARENAARALEKTRKSGEDIRGLQESLKAAQTAEKSALSALARAFAQKGIAGNATGRHLEQEFDFSAYRKWNDRKTTTLQKSQIIERLFDSGSPSALSREYVRNGVALVPDGLSFAVEDVNERSAAGQTVYTVRLGLLTYGDSVPGDRKRKWTEGNPAQNQDLQKYLSDERLFPRVIMLAIPASGWREVEKWQKGVILVSKGWIYDVRIVNAVRTFANGSTQPVKEIVCAEFMFRSLDERLELTGS